MHVFTKVLYQILSTDCKARYILNNSKGTFCKVDKHFETLILYLFIALSSDLKYDHEI